MLTQQIDESPNTFLLRSMSVTCCDCATIFATSCLASVPPVSEDDTIEGDLHRVLPDPALRAALIAICPECGNAHWTVKLKRSVVNPELLIEAPEIGYSKKFAVAVKTARANDMDALDIANIAINGLYCAREAGEAADLWLELAAYEHSRGMQADPFSGITGPDHLIMAEIWRQLGSFEQAMPQYELALGDPDIPPEVIHYQMTLARAGDSSNNALPPHLVRLAFPGAVTVPASIKSGKSGRAVPPHIARQPVHDDDAPLNGPPDRRRILSAAIKDDVQPDKPNPSAGTWSVEAIADVSDAPDSEADEADIPQVAAKQGNVISTAQFNFEPQSSVASTQPSASSSSRDIAKIVPLAAIAGSVAAAVDGQPILERAFSSEPSNREQSSRMKSTGNSSSSDRVARIAQYETIGDMMDAQSSESGDNQHAGPVAASSVEPPEAAGENNETEAGLPTSGKEPAAHSAISQSRMIDELDLPLKVQQIIAVPQAASSVSLVQATQVYVAVATPPISQPPAAANNANDSSSHLNSQSEQSAKDLSAPAPYMAASQAQSRAARRAARAQQEQNPQDKFPDIQITDEEAAAFGYGRYGYGSNEYFGYETEGEPQVEASYEDQQPTDDEYQQPSLQAPSQVQYASGQSQPSEDEPTGYQRHQAQFETGNEASTVQQGYAQQPRYALASATDPQHEQPNQATQYSAPAHSTAGGAAATETGVDEQSGGDKDFTDAIARVEGFLSLTRLPSYQSWIRGYRK